MDILIMFGQFLAGLMSTQFLVFDTGQVLFVALGAYGIWKIREKWEKNRSKGVNI